MKKFVLSEIMLLSTLERKAKRVKFDKKRTLIFGGNGTGKSCLIKSIYKTFGAPPNKDHPSWKELNPISLVRFSVDGINYSILRNGKFFAVFDGEDKIINVFQSVSKELSQFLANLFDFKIKLPNQHNEIVTPTPAYLFLPYYIDQDISWQKNWNSFGQLNYIRGFREPIATYHTGLKPNDYYQIKGEIEQYSFEINELESERRILNSVLKNVKDKLIQSDFNIDIDRFKEEVKELLVECETLKISQENLKIRLVELYNIKIIIESQLTITKNALNESRRDYNYATEIVVDEYVDCPTCGAHYENSFADRFEIAKDENRCRELLIDLNSELEQIDDKIEKENAIYNRNNEEILKIEILLEKKKGDLKLKDIIDNAGRNELKLFFEESSKKLMSNITETALKQKQLQDRLKSITDKDRRNQILGIYNKYMKRYLFELDVHTLKEVSYKSIDTSIPETGSALPRALIAYYFSIFQVMRKYTSSAFCPIVIDSPNQQAQDLGHVDKILKFIDKNQPEDSQLILGLEELYDVNFNCKIIELKDEKSLLQKYEYADVSEEIDFYLTSMWNFEKGDRLF